MVTTVTVHHTDLNGSLQFETGKSSKDQSAFPVLRHTVDFIYDEHAPSLVDRAAWLDERSATYEVLIPTGGQIMRLANSIGADAGAYKGIPVEWRIEDPDIAMLFKLTYGGSQ